MASIEIFIGAPLEHDSDRIILARAVDDLKRMGESAVLLANVELGGRQIDLIVACAGGALVLEGKSLTAPVRGGENGRWQVRLATGVWKDTGNAYVQANLEKLALRDAMHAFGREDAPYPDAAVVFCPVIPPGSSIPAGDFKVRITDVSGLSPLIKNVTSQGGWPLNRWRTFAKHHGLIAVPTAAAASSERLLAAEQLLAAYGDQFQATYSQAAACFVAVNCRDADNVISSDKVLERSSVEGCVVLKGASGCGKSILSYRIAISALRRGTVPIILQAKDFDGSFAEVADREASLVGADSAAAVIAAARRLGREILLIADGYNECGPRERTRLTRSLVAAVRRYGVRIIISTQVAIERDDLLPAQLYHVEPPDLLAKREIARRAGRDDTGLDALLETVASGLEATLVGQVGSGLPAGIGRYGLFDAFVRERLGPGDATDGIRLLSRVADTVMESLTFNLSRRELDRLVDREGISGRLVERLTEANILKRRGDRVSFAHEMFLNVFASEAIIRRCNGDADAINSALRLPQHADIKALVVGGIDDDGLRRLILSSQADVRLMRDCFSGQCGGDAQGWVNQRCDAVLLRLGEEIEEMTFVLAEKSMFGVDTMPREIEFWSPQEEAILGALPYELLKVRRLDQLLGLIALADRRLDQEHRRLREDAMSKKAALRSGLHAACFGPGGHRVLGLAKIFTPIYSGHMYREPSIANSAEIDRRLAATDLTFGQLRFLIGLSRYRDHNGCSVAPLMPDILDRYWKGAPYHVRNDLLDATHIGGHRLEDDVRLRLIAAIEALLPIENPLLGSSAIDALKFLGALDEDTDTHLEFVNQRMVAALADRENQDMWDLAMGLWTCQFDHPYDGAYCQAWNKLSQEDRRGLLMMAARCPDDFSMFLAIMIAELAACAGDKAIEVGALVGRWTALPKPDSYMPQDSTRIYAMAHATLARLRQPLPEQSAMAANAPARAMRACGEMLYWLNRDDLPMSRRREHCSVPLAVLARREDGAAAAVIRELFQTDTLFAESAKRLPGSEPVVVSFHHLFPKEIGSILRATLEQPTTQKGYYQWFRAESVLETALSVIGSVGASTDIPLLRHWTIHPSLGRAAVDAIKSLETRPTKVGSVQ